VKNPHARHIAALVAEDLSGRYKTLIDTLPQFLPFIGIEIKVLRLHHTSEELATIQTLIVAQPDDLIIESGDEPDPDAKSQPRDRDWWEAKGNAACLVTVDALAKFCNESVGPSRIDYTAQSYISLKKGRRCWLPMWPRANGVYVYLPAGEGGGEDAPSDFFNRVSQRLEEAGLESPSWTYKYNAGANPIGLAIAQDKANHSVIREILKEAYDLA
jgi:hypothetical protein